MNKLTIGLEPRSIASCPDPNISEENLLNAFPHGMLQHQVDVYQAAKTHDIVADLAPTGTGKTDAGLSVISHNRDRNAVYIAPTNALIEQQTESAQKFVQATGLPHIVKAASAKHIKNWSDDPVGIRSGEKLYNVLREPATIFPDCEGRPILLVTNPDIFYYAAFFQYCQLDRVNIAYSFYSSFATVIFDEFHLYDAKQLVSLFFYLAFSKVFRYFENNRKVVLLTATPEPAYKAALERLAASGVKIAEIDGTSNAKNLIPSQTSVELDLRPQGLTNELIDDIAQAVIQRVDNYPAQFGAVILDSLNQINRLNDKLCDAGYERFRGRITGAVQSREARQIAAQKQVILATSTVDVGFNFERAQDSERQNLDWLIFSSRDRFSFWQRIGRVGRVLGKKQTDIPSEAIAYLPEKAWEEGLQDLDGLGGRESLQQTLKDLTCMERPLLDTYWKSEAFLEIARPLLELETLLEGLPDSNLVLELFKTLQTVLGGKRDWDYYRGRMRVIQGAENIAQESIKQIQTKWKYIKGGQSFVCSFLKSVCPEDWTDIQAKRASMSDIEDLIAEDVNLAKAIRQYATIYTASYAPLFRFRDSLFNSLKISDPKCLLLDTAGETNLDPIHLLRFYEFETDGDRIEITDRAVNPYNLKFSLHVEDLEDFKNTGLAKLYAHEDCRISRLLGDDVRPTPRILDNHLISGVVVSESAKNRWAILRLQKQGISSYPIKVSDGFSDKEYRFFPSLSGILAIASAGFALKCPDNEDFYIAT